MAEKDKLAELENRIIQDINGAYSENEYDRGVIDGLKTAWFEIENIDKPYQGQERELNDQVLPSTDARAV